MPVSSLNSTNLFAVALTLDVLPSANVRKTKSDQNHKDIWQLHKCNTALVMTLAHFSLALPEFPLFPFAVRLKHLQNHIVLLSCTPWYTQPEVVMHFNSAVFFPNRCLLCNTGLNNFPPKRVMSLK